MCLSCGWEDVLEELEELLEDDEYLWAEDTLLGIGEWVEENEHVTQRQRRAIENIKHARRDP